MSGGLGPAALLARFDKRCNEVFEFRPVVSAADKLHSFLDTGMTVKVVVVEGLCYK